MIDLDNIKGAVFDVDDTLLDNQTPFGLLHEVSRYEAVQQIADSR